MNILHISAGWEETNGAAVMARKIAEDQTLRGESVSFATWASPSALRRADEVWIHCAWKPCLWWAAFLARSFIRVPAGSFDPMRLDFSRWKKSLVSPIEKFFLRRASFVGVTCEAEGEWVLSYEKKAQVRLLDCKRFNWGSKSSFPKRGESAFRVLYMGRRHPLKGVEFLETAVKRLNEDKSLSRRIVLSVVSNALGSEKEEAFSNCDILCLPTLSDNFGIVIAEALARGKRVITTDGAPAWREESQAGGNVKFIEGFRDGSDEFRLLALERALREELCHEK